MGKRIFLVFIAIAAGIGLYFLSVHHFLVYHLLAEALVILTASMIFLVAVISRHYRETDNFVKYLSYGMLVFVTVTFLHTLAFKGMNLITDDNPNMATQFWIILSFLQTFLFLYAILMWKRNTGRILFLISFNVIAIAMVILTFFGYFPICYIPGKGLTDFKILSEYIIIAIYALSIGLLYMKMYSPLRIKYKSLVPSLILFIAAEITFTLYVDVYGFITFIGHYFRIIGFVLIFLDFVYLGIRDPLNRIFDKLNVSNKRISESRESFRKFFTEAPLAYQALDADGRFIEVNDKWLEILGYGRNDVLGKWFGDFLCPDYVDLFRENFPRFKKMGQIKTEFDMKKRDGTICKVRFDGRISRDEKGNFIQTHCIMQDITEQSRLESELRQREERYKAIFNKSPIGICNTDPSGNIMNANDSFCSMLGYSREELQKMSIRDFTHSDDIEASNEALNQILSGKSIKLQKKYIHKNGNILHGIVTSSMIFDSEGVALYSVSLVEDITREKENELLINRAKVIADSELVGHMVTDMSCLILYSNEYFARCHGYTLDELIGMNARMLYANEKNETSEDLHYSRINNGDSTPFELHHTRKDGTNFPMLVSGSLIKDKEGNPVYRIINAIDITEIKQLEAENLSMEDQVKYFQRMEALGTMAGGIAHEINNPINGILNYGQLIVDGSPPDSDLHEYAEEIVVESMRISDIIRDMLAFSIKDNEDRGLYDISELINDTMNMAKVFLKEDGIDIYIKPHKEVMLVECKSLDIRQVFMNIITNARDSLNQKHPGTGPEKTITVSTDITSHDRISYCRVSIRDNGLGIPYDIHDKILNPFFTSKGREYYSGIGLSVSHRIVGNHDGFLTFASTPGEYAVFHVELPLYSMIQ